MSLVLSSQQRGYVIKETTEGTVPSITGSNAFRFMRLLMDRQQDYIQRRDKLGQRTFLGVVAGGRINGSWSAAAHLIPNGAAGTKPDMDPFFQAAMGGTPRAYAGGTTHAVTASTTTSIVFSAAQNLQVGDFIGFNNEIRAVSAITAGSPGAATTVTVDPPFSTAPGLGVTIAGSYGYPLGTNLSTLSIFSYWDPSTAMQQIINMVIAQSLRITLNGDTHEVSLAGLGQRVIDNISFVSGQGGLSSFPAEPASPVTNGVPIAGHYGQLWLGATLSKFTEVVSATLLLQNNAVMREREFSSQVPLGHGEGVRTVGFDFELFEQDDAATQALMTAAANRTSIKAFLQLGQTAGQLFAAYMTAVVPAIPRSDDTEMNRRWSIQGSRAQGSSANSELYIAFG